MELRKLFNPCLIASLILLTVPSLTQAEPSTVRTTQSSREVQTEIERGAFAAAKKIGTREAWQTFIDRFPNGHRAELARAYMALLAEDLELDRAANEADMSADEYDLPPPPPPPVEPMPLAADDYKDYPTVNMPPENSQWRNHDIEMDEGNSHEYAASITSNGLQFAVFCSRDRLHGSVIEVSRGVYPEFSGRLRQGLHPKPSRYAKPQQEGKMTFSFDNGNAFPVPATIYEMTGELGFPNGFDLELVENMLRGNLMTLMSGPFQASFRLSGSSKTICDVLNRCDVQIDACAQKPVARSQTRKTNSTSRERDRRDSHRSGGPSIDSTIYFGTGGDRPGFRVRIGACPRGTVRVRGDCVPVRDANRYCGPGYRRKGSHCVPR